MRYRQRGPGPHPRRGGSRVGLVLAAVLVATGLTASPAAAAAGDISTVAGAVVAAATATSTGMVPVSVAAEASTLLVADSAYRVVRRVDPAAGTQVVVAGNGEFGDSGDGGAATQARLRGPTGVAPDAGGGFYIADAAAHRVRHVSAGGTITTVAGTGTAGYTGDGTATAVALAGPRGVVADGAGGFYVADTGNHRVRHVDSGGALTTVAGTGTGGYSGDGAAATAAQLNSPVSVAVAGSDLFVADRANGRVRRIDSAGTITSAAGPPDLASPTAVAAGSGGVLVVDEDVSRLMVLPPGGGVSILAGSGIAGFGGDGGPPAAAMFAGPVGVAELNGTAYVADAGNSRVRAVAATVSTVAGNGPGASGNGALARDAQLALPRSVAVDAAGSVYVADAAASQVRRISPAGVISAFAGTGVPGDGGDGAAAAAAQLQSPVAVAVDASGNVYVADSSANRVRRVSPSGTITAFAGTGANGSGGDGGAATAAQLSRPGGLAVDPGGNVYVADTGNNRVRRVSPSGTISAFAGSGTPGFAGDGGAATAAKMSAPIGLAVGADASVYVADSANDRVRRVDSGGTITAFAGGAVPPVDPSQVGDGGPATAAFVYGPRGLHVDADGAVLIADAGNNRVRRVHGGTIGTIAGTGAGGFAGDGAAATAAQLTFPTAIVRKANGDLLIADTAARRVRSVAAGGAASGTPTAAFTFTTSGTLPLTVDLDASASSDPESAPLAYDWDFGDGGIGIGAAPTHVFTAPGAYTITLTVTDPGGVSDTTTQGVVVTTPNQAPTASLTATPASGTAPLAVVLDASASSDPESGALSYTFDPGDGAAPTSGAAATLAHTYTAAGSYTAVVTVQDPLGATDTTSATVEVAGPQAPTAVGTLAPASGQVPLAVDVDASASTDTDGSVVAWHWDFGDGATADTAVASHTYTAAGSYTATLTVTDDDDLDDTATFAVEVTPQPPENLPPVASFTATPDHGDAPLEVTFDASASLDPDGTIASWYWDFGDGQTSGTGPVVTHQYANAGNFRATLVVTDDDGAPDATDRTIDVTNPPGPAEDAVLVEITGAAVTPLSASGPGMFTVVKVPSGVVSVTGSATLPGGVTVNASVKAFQFFGQVLFNIGSVTVTDPATGRVYPTLVLGKVTSPEAGMAEARSSWFSTNKSPWISYQLHWAVLDAG